MRLISWALCRVLCLLQQSILRSILSNTSITTTLAFFWFPFLWNSFFHLLTFSLCVSLDPEWVSCRKHIDRSYFCIHSASLCLLVSTFSLLIFKVIIDMYAFIAILLLFRICFCRSFSIFFFCFLLMIEKKMIVLYGSSFLNIYLLWMHIYFGSFLLWQMGTTL